MSTYEQEIEPPDPKYQFVLFAAQPYNTVAFKIPNAAIIDNRTIEDWKSTERLYTVQFTIVKP